jgi:hypothetical protein
LLQRSHHRPFVHVNYSSSTKVVSSSSSFDVASVELVDAVAGADVSLTLDSVSTAVDVVEATLEGGGGGRPALKPINFAI